MAAITAGSVVLTGIEAVIYDPDASGYRHYALLIRNPSTSTGIAYIRPENWTAGSEASPLRPGAELPLVTHNVQGIPKIYAKVEAGLAATIDILPMELATRKE